MKDRLGKVLIIDDDNVYYLLLKKSIEAVFDTSEIVYKENGYDAMLYLMKCHEDEEFPDVILVDIYMPGLDGHDFLEEYQEHFSAKRQKTKVLVNSSVSSERAKMDKYSFILDFVAKPLTPEYLKKVLKENKH